MPQIQSCREEKPASIDCFEWEALLSGVCESKKAVEWFVPRWKIATPAMSVRNLRQVTKNTHRADEMFSSAFPSEAHAFFLLAVFQYGHLNMHLSHVPVVMKPQY